MFHDGCFPNSGFCALLMLLVKPRLLPRMDFSAGIPRESRTLVAVPAMLSSVKVVEALIEAMEVRFLANHDVNLRFALLTDFVDAAEQTLPEDAQLLRVAQDAIGLLNAKYRGAHSNGRPDDAGRSTPGPGPGM